MSQRCEAVRFDGTRCRNVQWLRPVTRPDDGEVFRVCTYHHDRLEYLGWPGRYHRADGRVTRSHFRHWPHADEPRSGHLGLYGDVGDPS